MFSPADDFQARVAALQPTLPAALINCLVSSVGLRLGRAAEERLQELQEAARAVGIYAGAGDEPAPSILDAYNNPNGSST